MKGSDLMSVKVYKDGKLQQVAGNADTRLTKDDVISILGYTPADSSKIGVSEGFATLDSNGKLLESQKPIYDWSEINNIPSIMDAATISLSCTGNSASATQLETSRVLTIGNTGKSFNGSSDVSWSLSEIGAAVENHEHYRLSVKTDPITVNEQDTTTNWCSVQSCISFHSQHILTDQLNQYGIVLNLQTGVDIHQLWFTQPGGDVAHRGGNGSGWHHSWRRILDEYNYTTYCAKASHTHNYPIAHKVTSLTGGAGWYRIAVLKSGSSAAAIGSGAYSVEISLKRSYYNNQPEFHLLRLVSVFHSSKFESISNLSGQHLITKIRHTFDSSYNAYIEMYYGGSLTNGLCITLIDRFDGWGLCWEPCLEMTSETVDGVSVISTMDIPSS